MVRCPKGHRFKCKSKHVGKRARCPKKGCGSVFVLEALLDAPTGGGNDSTLHMTMGIHCPYCRSPLRAGAGVCTECCRDVKTGELVAIGEDANSSVPASVIRIEGGDGDREIDGLGLDSEAEAERGGRAELFGGALGLPLVEETRVGMADFSQHYWMLVEAMTDAWHLFHSERLELEVLHRRIQRGLRAHCPKCHHVYPSRDLASRAGTRQQFSKVKIAPGRNGNAEIVPPYQINCPSCRSHEMVVSFDPFA